MTDVSRETSTTVGSLCTGYGGLELAVAQGLGGLLEFSWCSEIDPDANTVLDARFPTTPNIGDLTTADPPPVDIVTAGFPCQPLSQAGHRRGVDDDRWIWHDIEALIGRMEPPPQLLLLENVPGLLTANGGHAMGRVVEGLASLGYLGSWRLTRAADIGACHQRRRIFITARHRDAAHPFGLGVGSDPRARRRDEGGGHQPVGAAVPRGPQMAQSAHPEASGDDPGEPRPDLTTLPTPSAWLGRRPGNSDVTDPGSSRQGTPGKRSVEVTDAVATLFASPRARDYKDATLPPRLASRHKGDSLPGDVATLPTPTAGDSRGSRRDTARTDLWESNTGTTLTDVAYADVWGDYTAAIRRHEQLTGRPPPAPTDNGKLAPAFVEWMMCLTPGWVTAVDLPRTAQLRILGNGVVPPQAAAAYRQLLEVLP